MRTLSALVVLMAVLCAGAQGAVAYIAVRNGEFDPLKHYRDQIARLRERVYQAKRHQIALFIEAESKGNSRLPPNSGFGASGGAAAAVTAKAVPISELERSALITVYPVSSPLGAELAGVGRCDLLGAATLRVEARPAEGDDADRNTAAPPDVYLLAHVTDGRWVGDVCLVSVAVDDEGRLQFEQVLGTRCWTSKTTEVAGHLPGVAVTLADRGAAAGDKPARRATVQMTWAENTYRFALDLPAEEPQQ